MTSDTLEAKLQRRCNGNGLRVMRAKPDVCGPVRGGQYAIVDADCGALFAVLDTAEDVLRWIYEWEAEPHECAS